MNFDQAIAVPPRVISREVAGETVILDLESECYYGLDAVGTRIWQLIQDTGSLRAVHDTLLREYDVEEARLQADLEALIAEVAGRGLIDLQDTPGPARRDKQPR